MEDQGQAARAGAEEPEAVAVPEEVEAAEVWAPEERAVRVPTVRRLQRLPAAALPGGAAHE
jgi:hypothetical protein